MDLVIREPCSEEDFRLYYDLRWRILREPWTQSRESGRDEHEKEAIHLMAFLGGVLVGVGRVHFTSPLEARIRYMAVEPQHAHQGVGGRILMELETRARRAGARRIVLNAREAATPFYRKHGYALVDQSGTLFDSIIHWSMSKRIANES